MGGLCGSVYTFYYLNADGSVPGFDFDQCREDNDARLRAIQLLREQPERNAIEVWRGAELICRENAVHP